MPSRLRQEISFEPVSAETARQTSPSTSPSSSPLQKKQKMSLSQTYFVAASARQKLGKEASRSDHNLRLLVGHANLLDSLMLDLADAERQQEAWFNQTIHNANHTEQVDDSDEDEEMEDQPRHIRWADAVHTDAELDDDSDSDSDSDSEFDDDELFTIAPVRASRLTKPRIVTTEIDIVDAEYELDSDDEEAPEDEEDDEEHALVRVSSQQPPELMSDDDSSDDESQPPSPPQPTLEYSSPVYFASKTSSLVQSHKPMDHLFVESQAPLVASY